jgi:hypothetical protein
MNFDKKMQRALIEDGKKLSSLTDQDHGPLFVSSTAEKFAPGNFVTTWFPELRRSAVGVTRAIEDPQEANPRILVKWLHDLSEEWIRAEYLYLADHTC